VSVCYSFWGGFLREGFSLEFRNNAQFMAKVAFLGAGVAFCSAIEESA